MLCIILELMIQIPDHLILSNAWQTGKKSHWIKHTEEEEKSISLQHALITCKLPCTIFIKMKYYQKDIIGNTKKSEKGYSVLFSTCRSLQSVLLTGNFQLCFKSSVYSNIPKSQAILIMATSKPLKFVFHLQISMVCL